MKRMLSAPNIYLYREFVDFRKSINGLAAMALLRLGELDIWVKS